MHTFNNSIHFSFDDLLYYLLIESTFGFALFASVFVLPASVFVLPASVFVLPASMEDFPNIVKNTKSD